MIHRKLQNTFTELMVNVTFTQKADCNKLDASLDISPQERVYKLFFLLTNKNGRTH